MKPRTSSTIEALFADQPTPLRLFQAVKKIIESFGPVEVAIAKTQVSFGARTKFAWVWMPQMWIKKALPEGIVVSFALGFPVNHPRVKQIAQPYPGRWMHHVVIGQVSDLDDTVKAWLRAYEFGKIYRRKTGIIWPERHVD